MTLLMKGIPSSQSSERKFMKPLKRKRQKRNNQHSDSNANPTTGQLPNVPNKIEELPPNENLKKLPDEVYGDTEIPKKHRNL